MAEQEQTPENRNLWSWVGYEALARSQFERGDFEAALASYQAALQPQFHCPGRDQQRILRKMMRCSHQLGDLDRMKVYSDRVLTSAIHRRQHMDIPTAWWDHAQFYLGQIRHWYFSQSKVNKTMIHITPALLTLYIALGGRFGIDFEDDHWDD